MPSSKDVVSNLASAFFFSVHFIYCFFIEFHFLCGKLKFKYALAICHRSYDFLLNFSLLQQPDSERARSSSRNGSTSKRPVVSSSRPSPSGEPSENRSSRLVSSNGRLSTTQRVQPGFESKSSSFTRTAATRGGRDDTFRSFDLLTIGSGKRK